MATSPLPSRGPHGGEKSIWLHHPCLLMVPMVGTNQYGYITPAFSGSPWWGEFNVRDGKWVKMVENGQKRVTIQMCRIPNAWKAKKTPQYGTKNLSKGAKSRVRVFADIQNVALRAHGILPHSLIFQKRKEKKKGHPPVCTWSLISVRERNSATWWSEHLQMKYAGSNPPGCIFITFLKVVSLLKKLFFLHKQSLPQKQPR